MKKLASGEPYSGYRDSVPPQSLEPRHLASGSKNVVVNPLDGSAASRGGSLTLLQNLLAPSVVSAARGMRARRSREIKSRSSTLASQTCTLYSGSTAGSASDEYACFGVVPATGFPYTLGDVSALHTEQQVVPFPTAARLLTVTQRQLLARGSWDFRAVRGAVHWGGYNECPGMWNLSGPEKTGPVIRVRPWGHVQPAWFPSIGGVTEDENADGAFKKDYYFAVAIVYRKNDGSYTAPLMPKRQRRITSTATPRDFKNPKHSTPPGMDNVWDTDEFGYYKVTTAGVGLGSRACWLAHIPVGDVDVDARIVLRTPLAASLAEVDLSRLSVWETINNNTQTTLMSQRGDGQLFPDAQAFRLDGMMPPRSRLITTHDQRVWVAHTKPSNVAGFVCPMVPLDDDHCTAPSSATVQFDGAKDGEFNDYQYFVKVQNENDGDALAGSEELRVTVYVWDGSALTGAIATFVAVNYDSEATIEDVFDDLNCRLSEITRSAGPPVKYTGGVSIIMPPNFDGRLPARCLKSTAPLDYGDNFTDSGGLKTGVIRCYGNSLPAALYVDDTRAGWGDEAVKGRRFIYFTGGGPNHSPDAACNFYVGNFRSVPEDAGEIIGIGSAQYGLVVFCTNGSYVIGNALDQSTNNDEDYTVRVLNKSRQFIAPDTTVEANGWCASLSTNGMVATDGRPNIEQIITEDLLDPSMNGRGCLYNEVSSCSDYAASRTFALCMAFASVVDSVLYLGYRSAKPSTTLDRMVRLDFSPSQKNRGLAGLLREDGTMYGWSAPCEYAGAGPVCKAYRGSSKRLLMLLPTVDNTSGDGSIAALDSGSDDDGVPYDRVWVSVDYLGGTDYDLQPQDVGAVYASGTGVIRITLLKGNAKDVGAAYELPVSVGSSTFGVTEHLPAYADDKINTRRVTMKAVLQSSWGILWGMSLNAADRIRR